MLLCSFVGCSGSGPTAKPATPDAARSALTSALDAWKQGTTHDQFKEIAVSETQWSQGWKLSGYEIAGEPTKEGADLRYKVKLSLESPKGDKVETDASYTVATNPNRVVVRDIEM